MIFLWFSYDFPMIFLWFSYSRTDARPIHKGRRQTPSFASEDFFSAEGVYIWSVRAVLLRWEPSCHQSQCKLEWSCNQDGWEHQVYCLSQAVTRTKARHSEETKLSFLVSLLWWNFDFLRFLGLSWFRLFFRSFWHHRFCMLYFVMIYE